LLENSYFSPAQVYTGAKAKELGLVDEFGSLDDAIDVAAKLGGIEGKPDVTYANRPSLSRLLFGGEEVEVSQFTRYFDDNQYGRLVSIIPFDGN
jgi:protease-4